MEKLLSIVIPTYNVEKYLSRCLDSLTFNDKILDYLDIIVVNDGSKDDSLKIAKEYSKKYDCIRVIDKENGGHGSTINAGLKIAKGKYFRVIDSDDWVNIDDFPKYVEDLKKIDADLIITNFAREYIFNSKQDIYNYPKELEYNKVYDLNKFDFSILKNDYFYMATSTIKTSILRGMNLQLDEKTFYVDMEYNIFPLKYINTMIYLDYNIYRYFIGRPEQSINGESFVKHRRDHEKVLKKLINYYQSEDLTSNRKDFIKRIILATLDSHYVIYCNTKIDSNIKSIMKKEIRSFTRFLENTCTDLYNSIRSEHLFIKSNIDTNFLFACGKNNYFTRIMLVIQNRREK